MQIQQLAIGAQVALQSVVPIEQTGADLGRYLSYLARRQEVIASNIANADTPGYKTRDISSPPNFAAAFAQAQSILVDSPDLPARNDGNNVSMDREAQLLSETAMKFNLATQMVRGEIKSIRAAIEEGRNA